MADIPTDEDVNAYLRRVVSQLVSLYKSAQDEIMQKLAVDVLTIAGERRLKGLLAEVKQIVAALDAAVVDFSTKSTLNAARYGARAALDDLIAQGVKSPVFDISARNPAIKVIADSLAGDMLEANQSMISTSSKAIRKAKVDAVLDREMTKAVGRGVINGETRRETTKAIAQEIRDTLADGNIVQAGKRRYSPDKYAELVARTRTREAVTEGTIQGAVKYGIDLFQVSVHDGPCDQCKQFQGKVYSLSGNHPDFPPLLRRPPFHPHCKHTLVPRVEVALKLKGNLEALSEFSKSDRVVKDGPEYDALIKGS